MMNQKMRAKRRMNRKLIAVVALLVSIVTVLAAGGTLAYFTAEETAYNVITTGCLYMDLVEETTGGKPWPEGGITGVMPAMDVDKVVYVENVGSVPFFTRVSMDQVIIPAEGSDAQLSFEYISIDLNTEQWIAHEDGYYYYYRILQPGEKTEPLFTKVHFAPEMGNEYMDATVEIYVLAQAVQSANNGEDPLLAMGWSESAKTVIEAVNDALMNEPAYAIE